jgi:very-short-patch-repair endonuclease
VNLSANRYEWTLNHAVYDSEFEKKVYQYLAEYIKDKEEMYDIKIYNQVETCGQKRLDFVLFNEMNEKAVAIEVDGCYHYQDNQNTKGYSIDHTDRMNILKRAGWNVINTPFYKWYENGWLCDSNHHAFKKELNRITSELDKYLF